MIRLNQTHVREEEFCKYLKTQEKFVKARLFFYFNVEHVFIVNIEKQTQNKNFADFIKRILWIFKIFKKSNFVRDTF